MPTSEEIFATAERQGITIAEYLSRNYTENQLAELEANVITQLDSLRSEICDFMQGIEVQATAPELVSASREKLNVMQTRIREKMHAKSIELEELISSPAFDIVAQSTPVVAEEFEEESCIGSFGVAQQVEAFPLIE